MRSRNRVLVLAAAALLAAPFSANAGGGSKSRSFDVCVNAGTDFVLNDTDGSLTPTAGDIFTAVGPIYPKDAIPVGGVAGDCSGIEEERIGTFYVNGHFVNPLFPDAQEGGDFPAAPEDVLALVTWHFDVGDSSLDTIGPVRVVEVGESYPQTVVGGTGDFKSAKGVAKTIVLGGGGFQFRMEVKNGNSD